MADLDILIGAGGTVPGESITFGDTPSAKVGTVLASVSESLHLAENAATDSNLYKSLSESLHFTDSPTILMSNYGVFDIVEELETYELEGESPLFIIDIKDHMEVVALQGYAGELGRLEGIDPMDQVSIQGLVEVIGQLILLEPVPRVNISGVSGVVGELTLTDPLDSVLITGDLNSYGVLEIVDPLDDVYIQAITTADTLIYKAVVMNLNNNAVSEFRNYNFNSIVYFNGVFLGLGESGVYILDGEDDLGSTIEARIKSGLEDFGKNQISIPREAWMAFRSNNGTNSLRLDVRVDEKTDLYPAYFGGNGNKIGEARSKLGRGIKARFFTWELRNLSGSRFMLESLRILGDVIKRKTR